MLVADIITAIEDKYTTETIAEAKMKRYIATAVKFYSRYNPYMKSTNFDTVKDQKLYDLPSDCIREMVLDVDYWPTGGMTFELSAKQEYETIYQRPASYDLISERVIEDIKQSEHINRVRGQWEIENGQIALWPVPGASSTTVYVTYGSVHALTGGTTYATIPDEDLDIIADLAMAEIIKGKRVEFAVEPDYAEGLQRQVKRWLPGNIDETVKSLRAECVQKYSGAAVAV
jgi:hypothetical protein